MKKVVLQPKNTIGVNSLTPDMLIAFAAFDCDQEYRGFVQTSEYCSLFENDTKWDIMAAHQAVNHHNYCRTEYTWKQVLAYLSDVIRENGTVATFEDAKEMWRWLGREEKTVDN